MASKDFDTMTHFLVPEHNKLTQKERQELLSTSKFSLRDLPKIFITDPAIENFDTKVGDIIKIKRKSPTAGETIMYRRVANE